MQVFKRKLKVKGKLITEITVENNAGLKAELCTYGASIRGLYLPNNRGEQVLVTLAPKSYENYLLADDYHGKTVGRTAGRLAGASYTLDGVTSCLEKNNMNIDNLHGGALGLSNKNFNYNLVKRKTFCDVIFYAFSPDGEGGYRGNVDISVTYRIYKDKNIVDIIYGAIADSSVLLNLTNHVYFNLSGNIKSAVNDTMLYINADKIGKLNDRFIITDKVPATRVFDFRVPKKIGDYLYDKDMQAHTRGYDHQFFLNSEDFEKVCASAYYKDSGIKLKVYTTYPVVVFYSNNYPTEFEVMGGEKDGMHKAFCLECQFHPDGVHQESARNGVIKAGEKYSEKIRFEFCVE
ncbi:MAG: galactose mutarotase [Clostridia bacterium]|nr:galactose mutarotase [Clostridia bacterium]